MVTKVSRDRSRETASSNKTDAEAMLETMGIKSFVQEYKALRKRVASESFSAEDTRYALLRAQLSMLIQALPVAEKNVHSYGSERAFKSMVILSNHIRECSHDLQALGDPSIKIDSIQEQVVRRIISSMTTSIIASLIQSRQELYAKIKSSDDKKRLDKEFKALQQLVAEAAAEADVIAKAALSSILK